MDNAFDYIINKQKGGIDTEAAYPYRGEDERCAFESSEDGAKISNWTDVPSGDEDALLDALATVGPVSVADWTCRASGDVCGRCVLTPLKWLGGCSSDPSKADHGVAVVGYGTDPTSGDYWIVRTLGVKAWGEYGYVRLKGAETRGVANFASYPTAKTVRRTSVQPFPSRPSRVSTIDRPPSPRRPRRCDLHTNTT